METMIIRKAGPDDAAALARVQTASWRDAFADFLPSEILEAHTDFVQVEAMYRRVLQHPVVHILIGSVGGTPHCIAAWSANRDGLAEDVAELICIHSLSSRWRCGYGSAMMQQVLSEMRHAAFRRAVLWVFTENRRARAFYEALGFSADSAVRNVFGTSELRYQTKL